MYAGAAQLYAFQATAPGLLIYGLLVFAMEFITPSGQASDVAEYMSHVRRRGLPPGPLASGAAGGRAAGG
jgi:hypothetical protein